MLLGGYVAEQIVFERTTTGAADDLKRVVTMSRAMIEEYGMGSQLFLATDPAARRRPRRRRCIAGTRSSRASWTRRCSKHAC